MTHAQGNCVLVAGLLMLLYKSILLELLTGFSLTTIRIIQNDIFAKVIFVTISDV